MSTPSQDRGAFSSQLGSAPLLLCLALGFLLAAAILLLGLLLVLSDPDRRPVPGEKALLRGDVETAARLADRTIRASMPGTNLAFLNESELVRNLGQMLPIEQLKPLYLVQPQRRILEDRPEFRWVTEQRDRTFDLTLSCDGQPLWRRAVSGLRAAYPADVPALEAGKTYAWTLGRSSLQRRGVFQVVGEERRRRVEESSAKLSDLFAASPPMKHFVLGCFYYGEGLYRLAIDHFEVLNRQVDKPAIADGLGLLYARVGLTPRVQQLVGRSEQTSSNTTPH